MTAQTILHLDLDAFFASVEQRDDPSLRGKPVLVGGSRNRGVVAAASYEARKFGIHSAMPMAQALRNCPEAIIVRHSMGRYADASRSFFTILDDFSPSIEPLSLDEAFVDATGSERLLGTGVQIAERIKARVQRELGLVVSAGVASTKFVAKIASDIDKPDGLRVVEPDRVLEFLHPLPLSRLWGVGRVTQEKLSKLGLRTIGDVAGYPESVLYSKLGSGLAAHLAALASGKDPRPVTSGRSAVSIGHEQTFAMDLGIKEDIGRILLGQSDRVAARLRHQEFRCRTVVLKIKFADFRLITRRTTLSDSTNDGNDIASAALSLLEQVTIHEHGGKKTKVRLCGVAATGLVSSDAPRQLALDHADRARRETLSRTLDKIHDRFGHRALERASLIQDHEDGD